MYILISISSYLLGSIPSANVLGKIYQPDIRTKGSENVSTINTRAVPGKYAYTLYFKEPYI